MKGNIDRRAIEWESVNSLMYANYQYDTLQKEMIVYNWKMQ